MKQLVTMCFGAEKTTGSGMCLGNWSAVKKHNLAPVEVNYRREDTTFRAQKTAFYVCLHKA